MNTVLASLDLQQAQSAPLSRAVPAGLLLGLLAALLNWLVVPPVYSGALFVGPLLYFSALLRYGLPAAVLAVIIGQSPLLAAVLVPVPLLEALVVFWLVFRRGWRPVAAILMFWLTLGPPIVFLLLQWRVGVWQWSLLLSLVGVGALTSVVMMLLATHLRFVSLLRGNREGLHLRDLNSSLLTLFACLPLLLVHVVVTPAYVRTTVNALLTDIRHDAELIAGQEALFIDRNRRGLETIAAVVARNPDTPLATFESMLPVLAEKLPDVFAVLLLDREGFARAAHPEKFPDGVAVRDAGQSYADRRYFQDVLARHESVVGDAVMGRRMNPEPILPLAVPIGEKGHLQGVVLGTLPLRALDDVITLTRDRPDREHLLYDRQNQLLHASASLQLIALSKLAELPFAGQLQQKMPSRLAIGSDLRPALWGFRLVIDHGDSGIRQVTLQNMEELIYTLSVASVALLSLLLLIIGTARYLSNRYSESLLLPLHTLIARISSLDAERLHLSPPVIVESASQEVLSLVRSFNGLIVRIAKSRLETEREREEKARINAEVEQRISDRTAELRDKAEALESISNTDALTGLGNRRHFENQLEALWQTHSDPQHTFSLLIFDVDHFKRINDQYGHPVGDEVLRRIGQLTRQHLRPADHCARWGGEEFIILLPDSDERVALAIAERLRTAFERDVLDTASGELRYTVSIGVCTRDPGKRADSEALITCADHALYRAKREGRNRVVSAHPD